MKKSCVLVSGGAGYIGSHTSVELINAGYDVVIVDNLSNSDLNAVEGVRKITGVDIPFVEVDCCDRAAFRKVFEQYEFDSVIHFAASKAVGESVVKPLEYYDNNVNGTLVLARCMRKAGVKSLVFSSSATVYGDPAQVPITEQAPTGATTNPYGRSKYIVEECLRDLCHAEPDWSITLLRYFNPVGAHPSGQMGEDPQGIPNNLMPFIAQVAVGRREKLAVFGNDYPTVDGTGVRDYIHVMDLADGHIAALNARGQQAGLHIYNLGTGKGYSVLDVVKAYEKACGKTIPYEIKPRRAGDIATCYSDASKAERELGWKAEYGIKEMCEDSWRWQSMNPNGYDD